jgi:hypothetical protein
MGNLKVGFGRESLEQKESKITKRTRSAFFRKNEVFL